MRRHARIVLAVVLTMLLAWASSAVAAVAFTKAGVATGVLEISNDPETEGRWIVYSSKVVLPGTDFDIVAKNLKTGQTVVFGGTEDQIEPDVSMDRVVYASWGATGWDIRIHDLRSGSDAAVTTTDWQEGAPRISGDLVVWPEFNLGGLMWKNLRTGESEAVPGGFVDLLSLDVDAGRIAYVDATKGLYTYRPGVDAAPVLKKSSVPGQTLSSVRLHGDTLIVSYDQSGDFRTHVIDLKSGAGIVMAPGGSAEICGGVLFHDSLAWEQGPVPSYDVKWENSPSFDGAGATTIADTAANERDLSMFGRRIVWEQDTGAGDIYMASAPPEITRTEGPDRYATAAAASAAYFSKAGSAILCTGKNFPDALAAAPFAKIVGGPLLLARYDSIPEVTTDELKRLGVTHVFIVGGTGVLNGDVEDTLETEGMTWERISGATRYETANAIAARVVDAGNSAGTYDGTAFFARGDKFPDALAVGPVAAQAGAPVFLVKPTELPSTVSNALSTLHIKQGFVIGGEPAVGAAVRDQIEAIMTANGGPGDPTERWDGADRYETAAEVVKGGLYYRYIDLDTLGLATGENFPDALGGGAALGYYGSAIALTKGQSIPDGLSQLLIDQEYRIGRVDIFGGSDVVSDVVESDVATRLK